MNDSNAVRFREPKHIFRLQLLFLAGFTLFAGSVVFWVARLIYVSWIWEDVFSASIGIAIVAVPIFLTLLAVFNYVFWGMLLGAGPSSPTPERHD